MEVLDRAYTHRLLCPLTCSSVDRIHSGCLCRLAASHVLDLGFLSRQAAPTGRIGGREATNSTKMLARSAVAENEVVVEVVNWRSVFHIEPSQPRCLDRHDLS